MVMFWRYIRAHILVIVSLLCVYSMSEIRLSGAPFVFHAAHQVAHQVAVLHYSSVFPRCFISVSYAVYSIGRPSLQRDRQGLIFLSTYYFNIAGLNKHDHFRQS